MMIKYALKYIKHIKINQNFFRTIGKTNKQSAYKIFVKHGLEYNKFFYIVYLKMKDNYDIFQKLYMFTSE